MAVSRRTFLSRGSIGVALVSAVAVVPGLRTLARLGAPPVLNQAGKLASSEQLVAHVRDLTSGEMSLMVGTNKVIVRDAELAGRLYAAARGTQSQPK